MGNRISGLSSGIDPKMVEKLVEVQKLPVENAKKRKEVYETEKAEFGKLDGHLSELRSVLSKMKLRGDFYKLRLNSSHPDILDGVVNSGNAIIGSYEMEVRKLARSEKELAYGFPDKDETEVGFGYMEIEREDKEAFELVIEPGSTLADVADQINTAGAGLKAMVINTGYKPDAYRLLVLSEESGKEAKVSVDPDTTYLEFKEQVTGSNLEVLFEDVPVTDIDNSLDELLEGVVMNIHRAEPGTRITVNVEHDVEATIESIKEFVDKYNQVVDFVMANYQEDPETGRLGILANDSSVKSVIRNLQTSVVTGQNNDGKFSILAEVGITTNPKTGALNMDEAKVKEALTEDYDSVAKLFIRSVGSNGIAHLMETRIRNMQAPAGGTVQSRIKGIEQIIKNQDRTIETRERQAKAKEDNIRRQFAALETTMAGLNSQSDFLKARLGGGGSSQG